jgi:hypothetical protein
MNISHNALMGFDTVEKQNALNKARRLNKNDSVKIFSQFRYCLLFFNLFLNYLDR